MPTSLFVGRFQPLHFGHLTAVEYALKNSDRLVIVLGSAEKSYESKNPFTGGERLEMLHSTLAAKKMMPRVTVVPVPDVENHGIWVSYVESMSPPFQKVFSNDYLTVALFRKAGYDVEEVPLYRREELMATEVRRRMAAGEDWSPLVPEQVRDVLERVGGAERVKELSRYGESANNKRLT
ncbi:MAG: nicotinamide-nucleotide adenylyltransferase [Nitrososphaerota archaeon]|nr:nicotinamide-nucleotide adenylyltransferase [Nitrososphaerota archaeon]MDG6939603.1 nicotinamide-nucleotide adenylyltransferase [Nitrososphaerota archaeon]